LHPLEGAPRLEHAYHLATHGTEHGIHVDNPRFVLSEAVGAKGQGRRAEVSGVEQLLKARRST